MNFCSYLDPERVFLDLPGATRGDFLGQLLDAFMASSAVMTQPEETRETLRETVLAREAVSSTTLGKGVWFPHARVPDLNGVLVAFARSARPLPGPTPDGVPVRFACLVVVPQDQPVLALKMVSSIARTLANPATGAALLAARTPREAYARLAELTPDFADAVLARDLMREPPFVANPQTPLTHLCREMLRHRLSGVPVCDADGRFAGEVEAAGLLRYGLPDFFLKLKSVAFVRDFDPCERYFAREAHSTAGEAVSEAATASEDATLLEVIHHLAVRRCQTVYVLRDGRPVGMIDQWAILNRVLAS